MTILAPSSGWRIGLEVCALMLTALAGVWFFLPGHFGPWRLMFIAMPPAALAALLLYLAGEDVLSGWFVLWKDPMLWSALVIALILFGIYLVLDLTLLTAEEKFFLGFRSFLFLPFILLFPTNIWYLLAACSLYEYSFRLFLLVRCENVNGLCQILITIVVTSILEIVLLAHSFGWTVISFDYPFQAMPFFVFFLSFKLYQTYVMNSLASMTGSILPGTLFVLSVLLFLALCTNDVSIVKTFVVSDDVLRSSVIVLHMLFYVMSWFLFWHGTVNRYWSGQRKKFVFLPSRRLNNELTSIVDQIRGTVFFIRWCFKHYYAINFYLFVVIVACSVMSHMFD